MTEPIPHAQKKKHLRQMATSCESCGNFVYDDEYECYTCEVDLDEDEMARFLQDKFYNCPYYQLGGSGSRIVRKQVRQAMRPVYKAAAFAIKTKKEQEDFYHEQ